MSKVFLLYEFLILENFSFPDERHLNIKLIGFICFHDRLDDVSKVSREISVEPSL